MKTLRRIPGFLLVLILAGNTACGPMARTARQGALISVSETEKVSDRVWEYSLAHPDGFTLDIREMKVPSEGICVAYSATQGKHSKGDLDYVISHALEHDGFVGGWLDSEDSLYYFDSVRIFPEADSTEAVTFAIENEQLAVFVLSTGEEIRIDAIKELPEK